MQLHGVPNDLAFNMVRFSHHLSHSSSPPRLHTQVLLATSRFADRQK